MATKVHLYQDCNITPIKQPNPKWVADASNSDPDAKGNPRWIQNFPLYDYLKGMGARDTFMGYDGTLNRAPTWCSDDLVLRDPKLMQTEGPMWERQGNYAAPPQELPIKMCMKLASEASTYVKGVENHIPFIFDLENHTTNPDFIWESEERAIEEVMNMVNAVKWAKTWTMYNYSRVGVYYWPFGLPMTKGKNWNTPENFDRSQMDELAEVIDYVAPCFYLWDIPTLNPSYIFDQIDATTALYDRFYSWLPRWAVITPTYQVYWPDQDKTGRGAAMNGKAVEPNLWKKFIKYLVDRDYHLYVWSGYTLPETTGVRPNLQAMKPYIL